jgi:succinyl-diaminopimelate desuccinylase
MKEKVMASGPRSVDGAEVVDLTRELIRFDTSNPPGNEEPAARYLGSYLSDWGLDVRYAEVEPGRPNLFARLKGESRTGNLVFSGHMDVVPVGATPWDHDPFAAHLVGERIVGRGAADMKGGVAAMAVALTTLARGGFRPAADIVLAVSMGEEVRAPGARHMAMTRALAGSRYLVIGEPTGLDVCVGQKGVAYWTIAARGIAAHSSTPHLGASAVSYAARAILALEACPFLYASHPILREPTLTVSNVQSSGAPNVVPDACSFAAVLRTIPGMDPADLDRRTQKLLGDLADEHGGKITVEAVLQASIPAVETSTNHPLVGVTVEALQEAAGRAACVRGFTGATEAAVLAPTFHVPFVICGPGNLEVAHQVNEWVDIAELEAAATTYTLLAQRLTPILERPAGNRQ